MWQRAFERAKKAVKRLIARPFRQRLRALLDTLAEFRASYTFRLSVRSRRLLQRCRSYLARRRFCRLYRSLRSNRAGNLAEPGELHPATGMVQSADRMCGTAEPHVLKQ